MDNSKKLTLAYSPCPNDCFIFDALVHGRIDTRGYSFEVVLDDVESLNQDALQGKYDITKLSYHAFAFCRDKYVILRSGSALGRNCGPLLIAKRTIAEEELKKGDVTVAIPGRMTTANFLLGVAYPEIHRKVEMLFSDIEQAVLEGKVDAGLIIHENRFTYADKGLVKLADLGEFWEGSTGHPIPLGGIMARRDFSEEKLKDITEMIRGSVEFAFANPLVSMPYVREHAAEMDEEVMKKHIDLYVNEFSRDLGDAGVLAIDEMFRKAHEGNVIPHSGLHLFAL